MHVLTFVKAARNCTELLEHGELSRAFHPGTRLRSSANWRANYNSQTCLSIFFSSSLWIVPQRRFAPRNLLDPLRSGFRSIRGELIVRLIARLFVWTGSLCLEISERSEGILRICDDSTTWSFMQKRNRAGSIRVVFMEIENAMSLNTLWLVISGEIFCISI